MKIIGHRGAMGLAPENTKVSLQKGLDLDVDEIEIDVRVTKDKVAILHHDKVLITPIKGHMLIRQHTFKELSEVKSDLMTLDDALAFLAGKVPINVEVKPLEPIKPIAKVVKKYEDKGVIRLGSKSQKTLVDLHEQLPLIEKFVIEPWSGVRAHHRAKEVGAKRLFMNQRWLWAGFIKATANSGFELYPYTLNDLKRARHWEKYGIAGVVTDYPDIFKK